MAQLPHCPTPRLSPSRPLKMHPKPGVLRTVSLPLPPTAAWPSGPHARSALPCPAIINHNVSALTHLSDRQPRRVGHCGGGYALFPLCDCVRVMKTFSKKPSDWRLPRRDVVTDTDVDEDDDVDRRYYEESTDAQQAIGRHVSSEKTRN